jgi:Peptidase M50B-like
LATTRIVRPTSRWLWIAGALCLGASLTPWGPFFLYPFKLFTTWVHECGHALMALLVGGSVNAISIEPDTSGVTESLVPAGRFARGLVASAGYLGASVVGCLLIAATRVDRWARAILWALGAFMLLTAAIWMRNLFGFVTVLAWAAALVGLARKGGGEASRFVLGLLAIQVALGSVYDIRVLFLTHRGHSDTETMAVLFLLPSWFWASTWMLLSVGMLGWTLWTTRAR